MSRAGDESIDWELLERLYAEVMALPESDRGARIADVRARDSALAGELESLVARAPVAERYFRELPRAASIAAGEVLRSAGEVSSPETPLGMGVEARPSPMIAQYRVGQEIGRGGMGVVYQAVDTRLHRPVALKFLPAHLSIDEEARKRFVREARAAAALDHPNICTVHDVGETTDGALFIAMAYYEGETVRDRLARGPVGIEDAIGITIQAAKALAAAHARGIIHRDVKPANLMLAADGTMKLLDFGIARLPDVTVTRSGSIRGTVAYMSPEQVGGEPVDRRTDLWSLGVVLYEMLTGRRPFGGDTEGAALVAILSAQAAPASRLRPAVPPELDDIVTRLLSRDPADRYADAQSLLDDLEGIAGPERRTTPKGALGTASEARARSRGSRGSRRAGTLAAAVAVVAIGGAGVVRWLGREQPPVQPSTVAAVAGERILIADFADFADDSTLGEVVAQALRMGLSRSSTLRVVGAGTVPDVLQRMRRAPDTPLDSTLAREVAAREGIKAVIQGEVRRTGGAYLITAAMEAAASGDRIEGWRVTARDSTEIPAAIDLLIEQIRTAGATTLAAIEPGERPPPQTTSSLGALRKSWAGREAFYRSDYLRAIQLFEEATALDSNFAVGHALLAESLIAAGALDSRVALAYARANELRDQLTESERHAVEGLYALNTLGDLPRAVDALRTHIEVSRGKEEGGWYASLGDALMMRGDFLEAEEVLQEARRTFPTPANQTVLVAALVRTGRDSDARAVLEEARRRFPRHVRLVVARANLEARTGSYAVAHAIVDTGLAGPGARLAPAALAIIDAARGRTREALGHLDELHREHVARGLTFAAAEVAAMIGVLRARVNGEASATLEVERALAALDTSGASRHGAPYFSLALFYASAGLPDRAERLLREHASRVPPELRGAERWLEHRLRATIHMARGNPRDALRELQIAGRSAPVRAGPFDARYVTIESYPELARVYDRLAMPDSALAVYERYFRVPDLERVNLDALELGPALARAAELYEARGERRRAAELNRRLADLWRDGDPEARVIARRAEERAAALDDR